MPEKGLRPSNRNERKLMYEVEGIGPEKKKQDFREDEGPKGGPIVTDDKGKGVKMPWYKKGGKVKKTGPAMVHKDEMVVPAKHSRNMSAMEKFVKSRNKKEGKI